MRLLIDTEALLVWTGIEGKLGTSAPRAMSYRTAAELWSIVGNTSEALARVAQERPKISQHPAKETLEEALARGLEIQHIAAARTRSELAQAKAEESARVAALSVDEILAELGILEEAAPQEMLQHEILQARASGEKIIPEELLA